MDYKKFWAIIDHEKAIKEHEGMLAYFKLNVRARGKAGGWKLNRYTVTIEFCDGENTLISYAIDGMKRIVKTADLEPITMFPGAK